MPTEQRQLIFDPSEVLTAVREHLMRTGQKLPAGRMVRSGVEEDSSGLRYEVVLETGPNTHSMMTVETPALAAALIMFCRDRSIPLPKRAVKSLAKVGDDVALRINKEAVGFVTAGRALDRL